MKTYILAVIRVGMPWKYKPTELSELPHHEKLDPQKLLAVWELPTYLLTLVTYVLYLLD